MKKIDVYSLSELKEKFPNAFKYIHMKYQESSHEIFWQDEIMDSLKGTFKFANVKLRDWKISDCSPSWVKFDFPEGDEENPVEYFNNKSAITWLKFAFDIDKANRVAYINHEEKKKYRWDFFLKNGLPWDCPFTGYCADYDFVESLFEDIAKNKANLYEAFDNLAALAGKLFRDEYTYQMSEEFFIEHSESNDWWYTKNGTRIV